MNIIEKLDNINNYDFSYFGINDMATNIDISFLIKNTDLIKKHFGKYQFSPLTKNKYIDYLFVRKFVKFEELQEYILSDEDKEKFIDIIFFIKNVYCNYKNNDIVKYLNENGGSFFEDCDDDVNYSILGETLYICIDFYDGLTKILLKYIDAKPHMIIDNFEKLQKIIIKNDELTKHFLKEKTFEEIKYCRLDEYLKIITHFENKKIKPDLVKNIVTKIIKYYEDLFIQIGENNVIQTEYIINEIVNFLREIKNGYVNKIDNDLLEIEKIKNELLGRCAPVISEKIDITEMIEFFKSDEIPLESKMLILTHLPNEKTNVTEHYYNIVGEAKPLLIDLINSQRDYFTDGKLTALKCYDAMQLYFLQYFFCEERMSSFFSMLNAFTKRICEYYSIDYNKNEFYSDINIVTQYYYVIFYAQKTKNTFLEKSMNYSIITFVCCMIEKLLRLIYKELKKDVYISTDWYSLGKLLTKLDPMIIDLLGYHHVKILTYFLVKDDNGLGLNYRNNFAHYKNINTDDFNYETALHITQMYLGIINTLYLKTKDKTM